MHKRVVDQQGEQEDNWVKRMLLVLPRIGADPADCFFTNALMGLKGGTANGYFACAPVRKASRYFLGDQIRIIRPQRIVHLGSNSNDFCVSAYRKLGIPLRVPHIEHPCLHPANVKGRTDEQWADEQAQCILRGGWAYPPDAPDLTLPASEQGRFGNFLTM
jgi:hypothetical protein